MDGKRLQDFWTSEADAILATYLHFQTLLPHDTKQGAAHTGTDGHYVEALLRAYLRKFLPSSLEVFSGFILRPAVKTSRTRRDRQYAQDEHSRQLDIIVYNSAAYPVFQRFENVAIVPPEGVIAIISVKKVLRPDDIRKESDALAEASLLCQCEGPDKAPLRGPFLALVGMQSEIERSATSMQRWIFEQLRDGYHSRAQTSFQETIDYIGAIASWSIMKSTKSTASAEYLYLAHRADEKHLTIQHLLAGIFRTFYHSSRSTVCQPGFTAFGGAYRLPQPIGKIPIHGMWRQDLPRTRTG